MKKNETLIVRLVELQNQVNYEAGSGTSMSLFDQLNKVC